MKILITTSSFGEYDKTPIEKLRSIGIEITMNPFGKQLSKEEALKLYAEDIKGVIAGTEDISQEIISKARNLKVISRCGIGVDNIDIEAAKAKGIKVFNTPEPIVDAVAELTAGLILSCLRDIVTADRNLRKNIWKKPMGYLLKEKILGIVGLGNIGKRLVELTKGFNPRFFAYDTKEDNDFARKHGVKYVSLASLLSQADIVSLHLPLNEETKGLFDFEKLNAMKSNAFLINTSRAAIIDEKALYTVLKEKKIAGAALDVFEKEPYSGPLAELDNVILTPHIGSYAKEARVRMEIEAVDNLIKGLGIHG